MKTSTWMLILLVLGMNLCFAVGQIVLIEDNYWLTVLMLPAFLGAWLVADMLDFREKISKQWREMAERAIDELGEK